MLLSISWLGGPKYREFGQVCNAACMNRFIFLLPAPSPHTRLVSNAEGFANAVCIASNVIECRLGNSNGPFYNT